MCGRYTLASEPDELVEAFDLPGLTFDYFARYNIAPGQAAPVVAEDRRGRRMGLLTWGFIPAWMKKPRPGFVNARSETVAEKSAFKEAFARRRCLIPADGFYEWERVSGRKIPFLIRPTAGGVMSLAGLWERWTAPGKEPRNTFVILTTAANEDVRRIHDRMPVIIDVADRESWLARGTDPSSLGGLLRVPVAGTLTSHEVSDRVNRSDDDDEGLTEPIAP